MEEEYAGLNFLYCTYLNPKKLPIVHYFQPSKVIGVYGQPYSREGDQCL